MFTRPLERPTLNIVPSKFVRHPSEHETFLVAFIRSLCICRVPKRFFFFFLTLYTLRLICTLRPIRPIRPTFPWDPRFPWHIWGAFPGCFYCGFASIWGFPYFLLHPEPNPCLKIKPGPTLKWVTPNFGWHQTLGYTQRWHEFSPRIPTFRRKFPYALSCLLPRRVLPRIFATRQYSQKKETRN